MVKKSSYKSICLLVSVALFASMSTNAQSANIFDYFNQKKQERLQRQQALQQQRLQQQNLQQQRAQPAAPINPVQQPVKRVVIDPPKIFDYRPDKLVEIDFSKVTFRHVTSVESELTAQDALSVENATDLLDGELLQKDEAPTGNINTTSDNTNQPTVQSLTEDEVEFVAIAQSLPMIKAEKDVADALVKYYASHPKLIWSSNNVLNDKAKALQAFLTHANEDGLDPNEYLVEFPQLADQDTKIQAQEILAFDVKLTARLLRYSIDAGAGRIVADKLSAFHDLPRRNIDLDLVLKELVESDSPGQILADLEPRSLWYKSLKAELKELDRQEGGTRVEIADNTVIRVGQSNSELPKIISLILTKAPQSYLDNHKQVLENNRQSIVYNQELLQAVKDLQKAMGRASDGVIGPSTLRALQGDNLDAKREKILNSLERLRWLPHDFSDRYVFINQPAYEAQYFENGKEVLSMKVVVGSARHQTYFFYDNISLVTFNPTWGVPRSIVLNEMMPRILKDPAYLARNGYEVFNASGKKVDAYSVNWSSVATNGYGVNIRQKPGTSNALGELKILFPNKHDIYMHDTPSKAAFQRDMRAISHGCVRLADPRSMAAAVMGLEKDGLKRYFGKDERTVKLDISVPVYLTYFTAWPDANDYSIHYYDDVYNRDKVQKIASDKTKKMRLENM